MTDTPKTIEIDGHRVELPEGRSVWAGKHDDSWFIQFTSSSGELRKLRLSYQAADALVELLREHNDVKMVYRYVLHGALGEDAPMKWEAVCEDILP